MNINATLFGQAVVFAVLIWFTVKFIWPPLLQAIEDRQKKIAEGLAAAERGQKELQQSHGDAAEIVNEAREKALKIVDQAGRRSNEIIDEARATAIAEGQRLVGDARQEVQLEQTRARDALRKDVARLAVAGASRLLEREIDPKAHADLIEKLATEIEGAKA
ncbi:MAG: F0F1 ATP synthase subunit B [Steroidobacteraceae bacterium]|nr:F0F1 ATP synthase subunit B [Steroidobacteraceae bacterium]